MKTCDVIGEGCAKPIRNAFTLIELLVVLGIVGLILSLLLPAIQYAREVARSTQCKANLKQLGVAIHQYHSTCNMFPPGSSNGLSMHSMLLPFVGNGAIYDELNFSKSAGADDGRNFTVSIQAISLYLCPSDGRSPIYLAATNYSGNMGSGVTAHGYNGAIVPLVSPLNISSSYVTESTITDGLSHTAGVCEILFSDGSLDNRRIVWNTPIRLSQMDHFADLCESINSATATGPPDLWSRGAPWTRGDASITMYTHIVTPNKNSCINAGSFQEGAYTVASQHSGGVNLLCMDGSVRFISDSVNRGTWHAMGSRDGNEAIH